MKMILEYMFTSVNIAGPTVGEDQMGAVTVVGPGKGG